MGYAQREQIRGKTPLQERRWAHRRFLGWEELEAILGVDVVEVGVDVRAADDHQAAVEDADRARVPAVGEQVQRRRVLEERAARARRRRARLEDPDRLVARLDGRVACESSWVAADAGLGAARVNLV